MKKVNIKQVVFILLFLVGSVYVFFVKSELYKSYTNVAVKDLNKKSGSVDGFSFLLPASSDTQTLLVLQTYLESYDELQSLDKKFHLKEHYLSKNIDVVERLKNWDTKEGFLELYRTRLELVLDETSGVLEIGFLHTNPDEAFKILNQITIDANTQINEYNKIVSQKQLSFIDQQVKKNKEVLDKSIKRLEKFQNKHSMLNPTQTAQSQFSMVAALQSSLIEKRAKLNQLLQYMNKQNFEVIRLKSDIKGMERTLKKMEKSLASNDKKSLNIYIFEYERLKSVIDLNTELYKQSLLQLEQIKTDLNKNSKMLLTLTKPYIPQGYKYPEKFKDIVTLLLILSLLYGIITLIEAIIKEHLD